MHRLLREHQRHLQEQQERRRKTLEQRASLVVDTLDAYLQADAELRTAKAKCESNNGVVIYDIVYQEQDARDKARQEFIEALTAFKGF